MDNYKALLGLLESLSKDINKFYTKGNSSAGTRIRQAMQEVKALAQSIREEISLIKKNSQ